MDREAGSRKSTATTVSRATHAVLLAIGDKNLKQERYFKESLESKSIVLSNVKQQTQASKSATRAKSRAARKHRMSRTKMKATGLIPVDPKLLQVDESQIRRMHLLWKRFMTSLMATCSNNAQLQNKLHEVGLLGAYLKVVENENLRSSRKKNKRAFAGFVVNETPKCLFVALLSENEGPPPELEKKRVAIRRLLKHDTSYAVRLPGVESKLLVLHGQSLVSSR